MKYILYIYLPIIFVFSGCNSRLPEISEKQVKLNSTKGTLYEPANNNNTPLLVIFDKDEKRAENWRKTAVRIAQSGYRVFITNDPFAWASAEEITKQNSAYKTAIMGVGKMAEQALKVAANDTMIGAVITLDAAENIQYSDSTYTQIPPRPHLILESTLTPQIPEQTKLDFFNASQEPKKLVWLATDLKGSNIVNSDLEPIVRRTVLMLIDRYLKGKM